MSEIFVHYLAIVIGASLIFYCIGFILIQITGFQPEGIFTIVFHKLFLGCFTFTAICALYFTSLKTIFSGICISLIYLFIGYHKRKNSKRTHVPSFQKELLVVGLFLAVTILIYSYRFYSLSYNGNSILNIPNPDFSFYARMSHFVVESGIESVTPTLVYPESNTRDPYHYFDLWFPGGISHIIGGENLQILFLVSYSIGISLVWVGFCALAEGLKRLTVLNGIIALFATFFLPLQWVFTQVVNLGLNKFFILTHAPPEYLSYGLWNMTKIYPVYLILIVAALAFLQKEKKAGIAALSLLPFIYTTISIPIVLALSLYIFVDYVWISKDRSLFIHSALLVLAVCIFIGLFYHGYLLDSSGNGLDPFRRLGVEPLYKSVFRPIKIFFDATFQLFLLIVPFIVLLFLEAKSYMSIKDIPKLIYESFRTHSVSQAAIILYVASLASWCILFDIIDANQFFATSAIPMVNILCFIVVIHLTRVYLKVGVVLLCVHFVNITNKDILEQRLYSEDYMNRLEEVTKDTGKIRGFLLSAGDYKQGYGGNVVEALGEYVTLFRPDNYGVNLSGISLPIGAVFDSVSRASNQEDFIKFIQNQENFVSISQSRIDFIEAFNIDHLVVSPNVELDSLLSKRVKNKVTDIYSQQTFVLLNKK